MPTRSGYQPLIDYLAGWEGASVVLTIDRIEDLIDAALPPSAYSNPAWWRRTGDLPVRLWRALGWRARYYPRAGCVRFTRDAEE